MATITSGSRSGGGKTFTVGDTVYFTNYSTSLNGGAGSNSGYTMPWHGKITKLYDTTYTNWIYTQSNADAAGKTMYPTDEPIKAKNTYGNGTAAASETPKGQY